MTRRSFFTQIAALGTGAAAITCASGPPRTYTDAERAAIAIHNQTATLAPPPGPRPSRTPPFDRPELVFLGPWTLRWMGLTTVGTGHYGLHGHWIAFASPDLHLGTIKPPFQDGDAARWMAMHDLRFYTPVPWTAADSREGNGIYTYIYNPVEDRGLSTFQITGTFDPARLDTPEGREHMATAIAAGEYRLARYLYDHVGGW